MKNRFSFFFSGMLVLTLTFGLVLAGCQNPSDSGTGNGGNGNGTDTGGSNPFVGTWTGTVPLANRGSTAVTLTVTGSNWTLTISEDGLDIVNGTYQRSGSNATLMVDGSSAGSASVSGNSLTFNINDGSSNVSGSLTKNGGGGTTSYTVTFNANGGSSVSSQTVNSGASISLPTTSRSSYTFNGWFTASSGGTKVGNAGASYTVTGDITLYAQWTASGGGTPTQPSAPTGVTATAQSPTSIRISWNAVSGATSYKVYFGIASYSTFTQLLGTTTSTSITDTDPYPGETWYYKVAAVNSAGESTLSSYTSATTPSILGKWYTSQSAANAGTGTPTYEFLSNGDLKVSGVAAGRFVDNYSTTGATGNTVIISSGGSTLGTATFNLSGASMTTMTITNEGTSGLSTGTYYKRAN